MYDVLFLSIVLALLNLKTIDFFSEGKKAKPLTVIVSTGVMVLFTSYGRSLSIPLLIEILAWNIVYVIGYIDLHTFTMVDALIYAAGVLFAGLALWQQMPFSSIALGAVAGFLFYGLIYLLAKWYYGREAFGLGDVMLIAAIGAWLGPLKIIITAFLAFYLALLGLIFLKIKGKQLSMDATIAFGPYICLAGWVMHLWGDQMIQWYFSTFLF